MNEKVEIHVNSLISGLKIEFHQCDAYMESEKCREKKIDQALELQEQLIRKLLLALRSTFSLTVDELPQVETKKAFRLIPEDMSKEQLISEVKRLRCHEDYTVGLYAVDRKPKKVSHKWIKDNYFKIKRIGIAP